MLQAVLMGTELATTMGEAAAEGGCVGGCKASLGGGVPEEGRDVGREDGGREVRWGEAAEGGVDCLGSLGDEAALPGRAPPREAIRSRAARMSLESDGLRSPDGLGSAGGAAISGAAQRST